MPCRHFGGVLPSGKVSGLTQIWTLNITIVTFQARWTHWCNSGVAVWWVNNHLLLEFEASPWDGVKSRYCKLGEKHSDILPSRHMVKLLSGYL